MGAFFSLEIMQDLFTCSCIGVSGGVALAFIFYVLSTAFDFIRMLVN